MTVLSRLTTPCCFNVLNGIGKLPNINAVRAGGHEHLFVVRQGQLIINRMKDIWHFYFVGLGVIPYMILLTCVHTIYGKCELTDYPKEGPPPRYWQFEKTPFKQFMCQLIGESDMECFERNLSYFERCNILDRWRREEERVKHLIGERWDYKGYYYQPVTAAWVDRTRIWHERLNVQSDQHSQDTE